MAYTAKRQRIWQWAFVLACLAGLAGGARAASPPNILFVIMDDVGIDQMRSFGYGGGTAPNMPTVDTLGGAGVRFRNTWSMPACSPSRALFFNGRFPFRTDVSTAIGQNDLANSMVSPYELTTPKLLARAGYQSGLFGKFHLGVPHNNPDGKAAPHALGFDFFAGWMDETGDPSSIDTTAGGVGENYSCGFVPGAEDPNEVGANSGACYMPDNTCTPMTRSGVVPPGRTCRDRGGIFDPHQACAGSRPEYVDFGRLSGHYVSPFVYNHPDGTVEEVPLSDLRSRLYRGRVVVDEAAKWIRSRPRNTPWMATVSFASAHTPLMQPPDAELRSVSGDESGLKCNNVEDQRRLNDLMIESLDTELGRLMVGIGLATRRSDGSLRYNPGQTNTMVVVVGDNGSLGTVVKLPFDIGRAKGTAYQTGVWVPLVVAGPVVKGTNRDVPHMVNISDLYQLFAEIASLDVGREVPRPTDSEPMLPYLTNPTQRSLRDVNFTQTAPNLQANGAENPPCVIGNQCTQLPPSKDVCNDNGGVWWGPEPDAEAGGGFANCCQVNEWKAENYQRPTSISPHYSAAIRNERFKIVQNTAVDYGGMPGLCESVVTREVYRIDEAVPTPQLDRVGTALDPNLLSPLERLQVNNLSARLEGFLTPEYGCPADGNLDFKIDATDVAAAESLAATWGGSSVYDVNRDGFTDDGDVARIEALVGTTCAVGVAGRSDPALDPGAVRGAVDEGVARGSDRGRVVLEGAFDFGNCAGCVTIRGPVAIEGVADPSGPETPDSPLVTTIDSDNLAPFVVMDESPGQGRISIERLWFKSSQVLAVLLAQLRGGLDLTQNRITGITPGGGFRFGVGAAAVGPTDSLRGSFSAVGNHIDTRDLPLDSGDDNGIALAGACQFDSIEISHNRIYTRGEAVEIEGCRNLAANFEIVGNDIITDAAISDLSELTDPNAGHPAALKVVGTDASSVLIADNGITVTGWPTAVCIMPGILTEGSSTVIRGNRCSMSGQYAALLGGWAGTPGFFRPSYLQNGLVENNLFEGSARFGIAFTDFEYEPLSLGSLSNAAHDNLIQGNSFGGFEASEAALYFGPSTHDNVFVGDPNGVVEDLGTNNQILP